MISDNDLYRLAVFLGSASVILIIVYHFLEINTPDGAFEEKAAKAQPAQKRAAASKQSASTK